MIQVPNDANQYLPPVIAIPSALEITGITQSFPMIITAIPNSDQVNTYQSGQLVRLFIPRGYGMQQANNQTYQIVNVSGNNLSMNVDSTNFDPFVYPPSSIEQPATLSPAGSRNLQLDNTTTQVPFQSLNNRGN